MRKFMNGMNLVYKFQVARKPEACANNVIKNEIDSSCWLSPSHPPCIGTYLHFSPIPLHTTIKHILNKNMNKVHYKQITNKKIYISNIKNTMVPKPEQINHLPNRLTTASFDPICQ